jgi:predicted ATP-binding protein involved in virulence
MRIDSLTIKNFKGFTDRQFSFHPEFNLVIGINGTGKTTLIDALAVALGRWQRGPGFGKEADNRSIQDSEVLMKPTALVDAGLPQLVPQWPVSISAVGEVLGKTGSWVTESIGTATRLDRSTVGEINFKRVVRGAFRLVEEGQEITLPLIVCYGAARLQDDIAQDDDGVYGSPRLYAYKDCYRTSMSANRLNAWLEEKELALLNAEVENTDEALNVFKKAVLACVEGASQLWFDHNSRQILIGFDDGRVVSFLNLSDGQRIILAMVGDIARRAITLNPQLNENVLTETPGVALIDELDLHLHPTWQRRVIGDLRRTFPKIQFFCTTHSPFLIQTLNAGDELLSLDDPEIVDPGNLGIEAIAAGIMGVTAPEASPAYMAMLREAKEYIAELDEASRAPADRLDSYTNKLAARLAPFAKNPAFQAVLEAERIMKLGK